MIEHGRRGMFAAEVLTECGSSSHLRDLLLVPRARSGAECNAGEPVRGRGSARTA